ncbi:phage virion morphogenesis protein [Rubrivivax gelatinosus]
MDSLRALEDWAEPLLRQLSQAEQRKLARTVARELRRSQAGRIGQQRNPDGSLYEPRLDRRRLRERMFPRLRTASRLRMLVDPEGAAVGFTGRTARIARVHQLGLRDQVQPGGPTHLYARRELLGFTPADVELVRDLLLRHLTARG